MKNDDNSAWIMERADNLARELSPCHDCPVANTVRFVNLPGQKAVANVLEQIVTLLFPGCHGLTPISDLEAQQHNVRDKIVDIANELADQCYRAIAYHCPKETCNLCLDCRKQGRIAASRLLDALPAIRHSLELDIQAAYDGDPAARSTMEIVMSYPSTLAITVHRIAHELYVAGVPLIPRVMSEYAHTKTGIDIHPGATIGEGFFIDHGTGVVIGETCHIGKHVKLYQGVTLGAKSFRKDENGNLVKGTKRHPDVEDNVVIYAGATILGGDTIIGHDSIIGASVWLVHSVPPYSTVYNNEPEPHVKVASNEN